MLSKSQIKLITSLKQKKYRQQHGFFVVEGVKTISELLNSNLKLHKLYTTASFNIDAKDEVVISDSDLKRISYLKTPNKALAIFEIPIQESIEKKGLIVALDAIRDPGNLGTIIRLCDWFGVKATMGSITRVNVSYVDLEDFLKEIKMPVFGAFMQGENVYSKALPKEGVLVMGNEANGVSKAIEAIITEKVSIPRFGDLQATESLNVATATAILLSEFRRQ